MDRQCHHAGFDMGPTLEQQIEFLIKCLSVASHARAMGKGTKHAEECLAETIKELQLLEESRKAIDDLIEK